MMNDVTRLLSVLTTGLFSGVIVVGAMAYYFGPTGEYQLQQVLLEPSVLEQLWYPDANSHTGGDTRFKFQGIDFQSGRQRALVTLIQYGNFYRLISGDKGEKPGQLGPVLATLIVRGATESSAKWQNMGEVVQEVQFFEDYYRVRLREEGHGWAEFSHKGILKKAQEIFNAN